MGKHNHAYDTNILPQNDTKLPHIYELLHLSNTQKIHTVFN